MENQKPIEKLTEAQLNRRVLCAALRAKMPEAFTWDYEKVLEPSHCGYAGCAVGLMPYLWSDFHLDSMPSDITKAAEKVGLTSQAAAIAFADAEVYYGCHISEVTPSQVADLIEIMAGDKGQEARQEAFDRVYAWYRERFNE